MVPSSQQVTAALKNNHHQAKKNQTIKEAAG
jgi:hypothetical protein